MSLVASGRTALAALVLALLGAGVARADTRRIAIVVGHNTGQDERPLRYAEQDAGKVARTLVEVGGVAASDVLLLQGRPRVALDAAFDEVRARIAAWHRTVDTRVLLFFYFSGHSDGEALELGGDRLAFADVKTRLAALGADVRVIILDTCHAGGAVDLKGGRRGAPYQIRLEGDLLARGEALLTSSAADEVALEAQDIGASYFTHHFVSGLRGAADASGDGLVTLFEAFHYAEVHTTAATADTTVGVQHPTFDVRLAGEKELVLADLQSRTAWLVVPSGYDRVLVRNVLQDQVVAEIPSGAARRISVAPGSYAVSAWRGDQVWAVRVPVGERDERVVTDGELAGATARGGDAKGPGVDVVAAMQDTGPRFAVTALAGVRQTFLRTIPVGAALRVIVDRARPTSWTAALDVDAGQASGGREGALLGWAGWRLGWARGPVMLAVAGEAGGGVIAQTFDGGYRAANGALGVAAVVSASVRLSRALAVVVAGQAPLLWVTNARNAVTLLPGGWLGVAYAP